MLDTVENQLLSVFTDVDFTMLSAFLLLFLFLIITSGSSRKNSSFILFWGGAQLMKILTVSTLVSLDEIDSTGLLPAIALMSGILEIIAFSRYCHERYYLERVTVLLFISGATIIFNLLFLDAGPAFPDELLTTVYILVLFPLLSTIVILTASTHRLRGASLGMLGAGVLMIVGLLSASTHFAHTTFASNLPLWPQNIPFLESWIVFGFLLQFTGVFIGLRCDRRAAKRDRDRFDPETGFLSPQAFFSAAYTARDRCRRLGKPASLMVVSLLPPLAGDKYNKLEAMKEIAAMITVTMRRHDLCTRINPTDYVILLPFSDAAGAKAAAERLLQSAEITRFTHVNDNFFAYIRVSIAPADQGATELDTVIVQASENFKNIPAGQMIVCAD